eukprot:CAMPEP_0175038924 /NCGR_PEP_ID=MMETSP0052_2-20121109/195_1 /TAXON_ID=51329 ORGANISM="Polytomella parva, Strain SAG 63-3" /NCGR_SAMPLE_ID=MMETSP0052_2 /ASSEMBLY_ACC=CAM_ASM_000194 /LENGTH=619 /DNA_ID=CAMNT_0016300513 /DNA_START=349 /DNA_END=2208 /DNA_ORIENTATION=-
MALPRTDIGLPKNYSPLRQLPSQSALQLRNTYSTTSQSVFQFPCNAIIPFHSYSVRTAASSNSSNASLSPSISPPCPSEPSFGFSPHIIERRHTNDLAGGNPWPSTTPVLPLSPLPAPVARKLFHNGADRHDAIDSRPCKTLVRIPRESSYPVFSHLPQSSEFKPETSTFLLSPSPRLLEVSPLSYDSSNSVLFGVNVIDLDVFGAGRQGINKEEINEEKSDSEERGGGSVHKGIERAEDTQLREEEGDKGKQRKRRERSLEESVKRGSASSVAFGYRDKSRKRGEERKSMKEGGEARRRRESSREKNSTSDEDSRRKERNSNISINSGLERASTLTGNHVLAKNKNSHDVRQGRIRQNTSSAFRETSSCLTCTARGNCMAANPKLHRPAIHRLETEKGKYGRALMVWDDNALDSLLESGPAKQRNSGSKKKFSKAALMGDEECPKPATVLSSTLFTDARGNLQCPAPIVRLRTALAATYAVRQLRPQPLEFRFLAIAVIAAFVNIPCGIWREQCKKFSVHWFIAVHATFPFVAMMRKAILMPKAAIFVTVVASVLGQFLGVRIARRSLTAAGQMSLTPPSSFFIVKEEGRRKGTFRGEIAQGAIAVKSLHKGLDLQDK